MNVGSHSAGEWLSDVTDLKRSKIKFRQALVANASRCEVGFLSPMRYRRLCIKSKMVTE